MTSIAVAASAQDATGVTVGVSVSRNEITTMMEARISDAPDASATNGDVIVTADEIATIDAISRATAIGVAASLGSSIAFSGGGAIAVNLIDGTAERDARRQRRDGHRRRARRQDRGRRRLRRVDHRRGGRDRRLRGRRHGQEPRGRDRLLARAQPDRLGRVRRRRSGRGRGVRAEHEPERAARHHRLGQRQLDDRRPPCRRRRSRSPLRPATASASASASSGPTTRSPRSCSRRSTATGRRRVTTTGGAVSVTADNSATITADAQAVSVAASLTGGKGGALSIGFSLAHNTIDNTDRGLDRGRAQRPDAAAATCSCARPTRPRSRPPRSPSRSRSASPAGNVGFALAGGGSESTNIILTTVDAYVAGSSLGTAASKIGSLTLTATSTATIEAVVAAVAASVSFGGKVGAGVALGVSVARNFIGWDPHGPSPRRSPATSSLASERVQSLAASRARHDTVRLHRLERLLAADRRRLRVRRRRPSPGPRSTTLHDRRRHGTTPRYHAGRRS